MFLCANQGEDGKSGSPGRDGKPGKEVCYDFEFLFQAYKF